MSNATFLPGASICITLLVLSAHAPIAAEKARTARTLRLAAGTPLDVEATIGDVRIEAWDREDVSVEIERRAPAARDIEKIAVRIENVDGVAYVSALHTDDRHDAALSASVVIHAPPLTVVRSLHVFEGSIAVRGLRRDVNARIDRGPIDARDVAGFVRLETGTGALTVSHAELTDPGVLRLRTFNGSVRLGLRRQPVDARILALSMNGRIRSDIALTMQDRFGPHFGEVILGRGEPVISIDVVNGDVEIAVHRGEKDRGDRR